MKNILSPTDFSETGTNACNYAAMLASALGERLTMLHVYNLPIAIGEAQIPIIPIDELDAIVRKQLEEEAVRIRKLVGWLPSTESRAGFPVQEISDVMEQGKFRMVVMGLRGEGFIKEVLIGSTSASMIRKSKFPVLVIPDSVQYKPLKTIILACDFTDALSDSNLRLVRGLSAAFKSRIKLVNVVKSKIDLDPGKAIEEMKMEMNLEGIDHEYFTPEHEDPVEGILEFTERHQADLVIMKHHDHSVFFNMTHRSNTRRMAFHSHVPVLNLPEKFSA